MYHSITIGDKNTWTDWHLIPSSRPVFVPPSVKTNYVDIPGGDGSLDLTTAISGRAGFKDRSGSFTFYVANGYKEWQEVYSEVMGYLHGKKLKAILEDDPNYYYEGRFAVSSWQSDKDYSSITISYVVGPYKRSIVAAGEDWLWDTFNFDTDMIQSYRDLTVDGTLTLSIGGDDMPNAPTIITSVAGMTVTYNGETYTLNKGTNYIPELTMSEDTNTLTFKGNGTITVKYERGRL